MSKESISALEFVYLNTKMNNLELEEFGQNISKELNLLKGKGVIVKKTIKLIYDHTGVEESMIYFDYEKYTKKHFPFLYFVIQTKSNSDNDIVSDILCKKDIIEIPDDEKDFLKYLE